MNNENETKQLNKTLEFIKLGNQVSLHFNTSVKLNELREALNIFGQYNRFNPDKVTDILMKHSDFITRIEVGLEGSVVIYVTFASWDHQTINNNVEWGKQKVIDKNEKLVSQKLLLSEMLQAHCDELSTTYFINNKFKITWFNGYKINQLDQPIYRVRLWWD